MSTDNEVEIPELEQQPEYHHIQKDDPHALRVCLNHAPQRLNLYFKINGFEMTFLHFACYHGKINCVRLLLDYDVDTGLVVGGKKSQNLYGKDALLIAHYENFPEIVKLLTEHKKKKQN
eukprot:TRINITY_DN15332_c0_g1_i1.p1 TRINITY_DN15332_c0_g1~~TRINITY_DN15332_c0_g1_i1.p1  ORF type:complete len:134 (-),score=16.31 TRINITY_DN15332_c0_g1_i1:52-408(-)